MDGGVPLDAFLTFAFLQRAGHLVRRYPCVFKHDEGRLVEVHRAWQHSWPDSAGVCKSHGIEPEAPPMEPSTRTVQPSAPTVEPSGRECEARRCSESEPSGVAGHSGASEL
jgi:hypothetical protein